MLTLAGKEQHLVVIRLAGWLKHCGLSLCLLSPQDTLVVLSQADHAHKNLWHCDVKVLLDCKNS